MISELDSDQFHPMYSGKNVIPIKPEAHRVWVNLVSRFGGPALEGHYLVEISQFVSIFTL